MSNPARWVRPWKLENYSKSSSRRGKQWHLLPETHRLRASSSCRLLIRWQTTLKYWGNSGRKRKNWISNWQSWILAEPAREALNWDSPLETRSLRETASIRILDRYLNRHSNKILNKIHQIVNQQPKNNLHWQLADQFCLNHQEFMLYITLSINQIWEQQWFRSSHHILRTPWVEWPLWSLRQHQ